MQTPGVVASPVQSSPPGHWALEVQAFEHWPSPAFPEQNSTRVLLEPQSLSVLQLVMFAGTQWALSGLALAPVQEPVQPLQLTHSPLGHWESSVHQQ